MAGYRCILLVILLLQNSFGYKPSSWNYKKIVVPSDNDGQISPNNLTPPPNQAQVVEATTQALSSTVGSSNNAVPPSGQPQIMETTTQSITSSTRSSENDSSSITIAPNQPQVDTTTQSLTLPAGNAGNSSANVTPPPIQVITFPSPLNSTGSPENDSNSITIAPNRPQIETTTQSLKLPTENAGDGPSNMTPPPIQANTTPSSQNSTGSGNSSNLPPSTGGISTNPPAPITENIEGNRTPENPGTTSESTETSEQAVTFTEDSTIRIENADQNSSDEAVSGNSSINHHRNPDVYLKRFVQKYSNVIEKSFLTLKEFVEGLKINETAASIEEVPGDPCDEIVDIPTENPTSPPINKDDPQDIHPRKGTLPNNNHTNLTRRNQNAGENFLKWILISKSRLEPKVKNPSTHSVNISLAFENIPDSYQEPIVVEIRPGRGNNRPSNQNNPPGFTFRPPQVNSPTLNVNANESVAQRDISIDSRQFSPKQAPNQPSFNRPSPGRKFYGPKIHSKSLGAPIKGPHFHNNTPLKRRKRSQSNDVVKIQKGSQTKNSADCIAFGTPRSSRQTTTSTASSGINEDLQTLLRLLRNRGRSQTTRRSG